MNKTTEDTIKLLDYVKEKQNVFTFDVEELSLNMKGILQSKMTIIPEIIIWDDTDDSTQYEFSFERNTLSILYLDNNSLWWDIGNYPFYRHFFENRIVFRYKNNFIIMDYDGYVIDIVLIPKSNVTDLHEKIEENSIIKITEEQYLSFRSFINDLKSSMNETKHIPTQLIIYLTDENIDSILSDISKNFINCKYICDKDNSIFIRFNNNYDNSQCIFIFKSENKDYITAIEMLTKI